MKIVMVGGHHTSAFPVIEELKKREENLQLYWIGHKYSQYKNKNPTLEYREITKMGIPFYDLKAGKFYKIINPLRLARIPFGFAQAFFLLLKIRPEVILSFGGYLAVPVVFAGWLLKIPSLTHEQTTAAGWANKFLACFAEKILISYEKSLNFFPKCKTVFTGLPLREEIFTPITDNYQVNHDLPTVYVTAGKTGSHKINLAVLEKLRDFLRIGNLIHQCGSHSRFNDVRSLGEGYKKIEKGVPGKYYVKEFIFKDEIGEVFAKANLVVARAGANTVGELLTLKKPAILIPLPWASHNEQMENAEVLRAAGIGVILEEKDLSGEALFLQVKKMLTSLDHYKFSAGNFKVEASKKPQALIVDEIFSIIDKKN